MGSTGLSHSHCLPLTCICARKKTKTSEADAEIISPFHRKRGTHSRICLFKIPNIYLPLWYTPRDQNIQELNLRNTGLSLPPQQFMCLSIQQLFIASQLCVRHRGSSNGQDRSLPSLSLHCRGCVAGCQPGIHSQLCRQLAVGCWLQFL